MNKKIYELEISLNDFTPSIYRVVLVASDISLDDLHSVIQIAMGWENCHLFYFTKGKEIFDGEETENYDDLKLSDLLARKNSKIGYLYDFGDSWRHSIKLKNSQPYSDDFQHPKCLSGAMSCPPEDCGGIWGYEDMLECIAGPDSEEKEEYLDWLGEDFDPTFFDIDSVNSWFENFYLEED